MQQAIAMKYPNQIKTKIIRKIMHPNDSKLN
jgi:hypothetical protein